MIAYFIAKWDGVRWAELGNGMDSPVHALAVFDDGSGPALYAGGRFTTAGGIPASGIARWDGSGWSTLGSGMGPLYSPVKSLAVFDDGTGAALYAAGGFTTAGGVAANHIAKWDGTDWTALASGLGQMYDEVDALAEFDDGSGSALYAGGTFTSAGGLAASHIARWDGAVWTSVGSGIGGDVRTLAVFDDGSGSALYAGGTFVSPAFNIAKWNGQSWSTVGNGRNDDVLALTAFDDGNGPALYAGGDFTAGFAKWNGSNWTTLGSGISNIQALAAFDDGGGRALYAGGGFRYAGGIAAEHMAKWSSSSWTSLGSGLNDKVDALAVFDDGGGPALYAAGAFGSAGGVLVNGTAKWDGSSWTPLGPGTNFRVRALAVFDDGSGSALYAGGEFAGGFPASVIAKWDGTSWIDLGLYPFFPGVFSGFPCVCALTVFDDGSGPALYAGGSFTEVSGALANYVAKWNGSYWSDLGSDVDRSVSAFAVFDDGGGPALYAGGSFTTAGGAPANRVAKWNGTAWTALGSGVSSAIPGGGCCGNVAALAVFDDGTGPALYAGGGFTTAGGLPANNIARWNGSNWTALGSGLGGGGPLALTVFDDGSGPALYAGGDFTTAGGLAVNRMARWDGSIWSTLGSGVSTSLVATMAVFNDRTGPALFVGGTFGSAPDSADSYLAKWGCPDTNPPTITCPPSIVVDDRRNNDRGEIITFSVTASDAEDPTPSLVCVPLSGSLFPRGTTLVTCTATDFSGNQTTCRFTVTVTPKAP